MSKVIKVPSVEETAFACPHCGAFTTQHWYKLYARLIDDDRKTPVFPDQCSRKSYESSTEISEEFREGLLKWHDQMMLGYPFFESVKKDTFIRTEVKNVNISECYNCKKQAIWVHRNMVFPFERLGPSPNADLPVEIARDFEEARCIFGASPRGAAALLRLAIQKLCAHLGERGKNIDDDIASLVKKGLNPLVQQSLDVVRVIGNEAVHPGVIDLRDDDSSAKRLFDLVNIVAEQMITHPKSVQEIYAKLPATKLDAIQRRDQVNQSKPNNGKNV